MLALAKLSLAHLASQGRMGQLGFVELILALLSYLALAFSDLLSSTPVANLSKFNHGNANIRYARNLQIWVFPSPKCIGPRGKNETFQGQYSTFRVGLNSYFTFRVRLKSLTSHAERRVQIILVEQPDTSQTSVSQSAVNPYG